VSRETRVWARLAAGVALAVVLVATVSPERPAMRVSAAEALAGGLLVGLALYIAVARRGPVFPRGATVSLVAATCALLGIAAAGEEVVWRRVVLGELLCSGSILALAGSSLAFAFAHRARPGVHLATGAAFGGVYLATGALAACIAAHWTYNVLLLWISGRGRAGLGASP
jgi:membrane protease YdiL (CAAX protease family)